MCLEISVYIIYLYSITWLAKGSGFFKKILPIAELSLKYTGNAAYFRPF